MVPQLGCGRRDVLAVDRRRHRSVGVELEGRLRDDRARAHRRGSSLRLTIVPLGTRLGSPGPSTGRYPAGSLVVGGDWFYGTYLVDEDLDESGAPRDLLGPFVGFRVSSDGGIDMGRRPAHG